MPEAARLRYTLVAGATAIVIGAGFTVIGLQRHVDDRPSPRSAGVPLITVEPPSPDPTGPGLLLDEGVTATPTPTPKPIKITRKPTPSPRPSTKPATPRTTAPSRTVLDAVLADINAARAQAGLPAYTLDTNLSKASARHNQLMINGCGLEHQCAGETGIGPRFTAQGVKWTAAGENIGFGSSRNTQAEIIKNANGITASMLAETPPDDGHRRNLLSTSFKRIGLSVILAGGKVWVTQDFVN